MDVQGTYTITRAWSGPGPAPKTVFIKETSYANGWGGVYGSVFGTGTAQDAFGDPPVAFSGGVSSSGGKLIQMDASSGTISLSGTISASGDTPVLPDWSSQGYSGVNSSFFWDFDSRAVTLHRDGAHNEAVDPNGTVHGDTTYSYLSGNVTVNNAQLFHPNFGGTWSPNPDYISNGTGPLFNISWNWDPAGQSPSPIDTWNSHGLDVEVGTVRSSGPPDAAGNHQWVGPPDAMKHISVSYTATDLNPNTPATATAKYDLRVHDQYDNWRRVDISGNPVSGTVGEPGGLTQIGQNTAVRQDMPLVSLTEAGIDWNAVGIIGGGTLSASSVLIDALGATALDPPTWPVAVLGLLSLTVSTVSSLPPPQPAPPVGPPDQINSSFLQKAYQNYVYDQTAYPGEENNTNLVDTNFAAVLANNTDFQGYDKGNYGTVSITATVYQQMLNYYFYADEYDAGGLAATNVPSTVHRPGGHVWRYLWTYAGGPVTPSNPS